jgi:processing peptidase subunit alpha
MYTRFYRNVLNGNTFVENVNSWNFVYSNTGLMGVNISCRNGKLKPGVHFVLDELVDVAKFMNDVEFERAKNQLKASVFMSLEERSAHNI